MTPTSNITIIERKLLAACINAPKNMLTLVCSQVAPELFHNDTNRDLYKVIHKAFMDGVNTITIDYLTAAIENVDAVGGLSYLEALSKVRPENEEDVSAFANVLISRNTQTKAVDEIARFHKKLESCTGDELQSMLDEHEKSMFKISQDMFTARNASTVYRLGDGLKDILGGIWKKEKRYMPIYTGWPEFDKNVSLMPGRLITIGARPKTGKSSLVIEMAKALSLVGVPENGGVVPTGIIDTEMFRDTVEIRLLASVSGMPQESIESRKWCDKESNEYAIIRNARKVIAQKSQMYWYNMPSPDLDTLIRQARVFVNGYGARAIFFDWLRLDGATANAQESQALGMFVFGLHALALELCVPIVLMCQMSRSATDDAIIKSAKAGHSDLSGTVAMTDRILWATDALTVLRKRISGLDYDDGDGYLGFDKVPNRLLSVAANRHGECHEITEGYLFRHSGGTYQMEYLGESLNIESSANVQEKALDNDFDAFGGNDV